MENAMFILTLIGTVASVVSAIVAVRAKNEAKKIVKGIIGNHNVQTGDVQVKTEGDNYGVISGVNAGEIIRK